MKPETTNSLKEIQPLTIKPEYRKKRYGSCGKCGELINRTENYCSNCGVEIDWRDEQ